MSNQRKTKEQIAAQMHKQKQQEEQERKTQVRKMAYEVRHAQPGWTVVIPKHLQAAVEQHIKEEEKQEEYERNHTNDYDDGYGYCHEDDECCRNCGSGSADVFGCCSMGCAKKAARYRY